MVETKSVKVDNWGVFFLQKLQNFFNKTDYCDLTLQFMDNSQLKVHRLVLSACTDYFNVLEQQTDCTDDILNMPYDLQADVVVPIVNFMYTGTLEFEVNMYGRLLKTAKDMNMTVLLKLLEAHKRTVDVTQVRAPPLLLNKGAASSTAYNRGASAIVYGRGGATASAAAQQQQTQRYTNSPAARRNNAGSPSTGGGAAGAAKSRPADPATRLGVRPVAVAHGGQQQASGVRKAPESVRVVAKTTTTAAAGSRATSTRGPSRFDGEQAANTSDQFESSFDNITYESRPLITARQIIKEESGDDGDATSRSFEQLRRGYTGVKRPAAALSTSVGADSPPEKKPNIEDVKEYIEAHRMRKKIVEEFNEDEDEDDEEQQQTSAPNVVATIASDDSVDHQKIISEVLKKYPHLVKSNKNIKLKITQKGQQQTITAPVRKTATPPAAAVVGKSPSSNTTVAAKLPTATASAVAKTAAAATDKASPPVAGRLVVAVPTSAPKKIDSKTMHALIAKGAENTTGPWLCLKCGINGRPISIPSYKGFRRHLINVHKQKIDPKLCEHCGWRSTHKSELHHHMFVVHNITPPADLRFPKCGDCVFIAVDSRDLRAHQLEVHTATNIKYPSSALQTASSSSAQQQHCIYCNKTFVDETRLFEHIKTVHKERACEDGLMEDDDDQLLDGERGGGGGGEDGEEEDDDELEDDDEDYVPPKPVATAVPEKRKINVLSSITLPSKGGYVLDGTKVAKVPTSLAPAATSGKPSSTDRADVTVSRRSGTLDPVTGTFAADEEDNSHAAAHHQHADEDEEMAEEGGNKSCNATTAEAVSAAAVAQMSQDEADNHAYLEFVMAEVHGEKKQSDVETPASSAAIVAGGADVTHFVTEEGATMQLTEEQKKELIDQLHDQSGVVMVLKDDGTSAVIGEAAADNTSTTTAAAAAANVANQTLDELTESMDWELEVPQKSTVDGDANKAKASTGAKLSEKAKELIGDWSADETDESMVDESGKTAEEVDEEKADASTVDELKSSAEGVASTDDVSTATAPAAAPAIVKRAYGVRGSRDSNKETDVAGSSSTSAAAEEHTSEFKEEEEGDEDAVTTKANHDEAEEEGDTNASGAEINEPTRDAETMKKDSNIEIKSLINDWGEEDDDEEDETLDK